MAVAVALAPRTSVAGAQLDLLVLAAGRGACIGVDMASGAFVLARWPACRERAAPALHCYDVATARLASGAGDEPARPEAVSLVAPPHPVARLRRRGAERYLRPLLLPEREHLLGTAASAMPYWTVSGDRASVCLVAPSPSGGVPLTVTRAAAGLACRFSWRGVLHELALADGAFGVSVGPAMDRSGRVRLSGAPLADLLGFVPRRVLVTLSPPHAGLCHKVVPALLP
jgi:hypothetical protein